MAIRRIPVDTVWKFVTVVTNGVTKIYHVPNFRAMRNMFRKK